ncbi:hypothetical protein K443DRAFT_197838 [Laccaria amethystina LaAM-08-1]|uniref:Uncharacterized protein n=1 Tax=Laccaria amethystina LaAM-08-1 TaxID=1095629 RepID=A0A0C9X0Q7_9AGAR|nr:hypothetical protein K443DRAFT_197838 [Laccaria amethystina LaAM-08-1]
MAVVYQVGTLLDFAASAPRRGGHHLPCCGCFPTSPKRVLSALASEVRPPRRCVGSLISLVYIMLATSG